MRPDVIARFLADCREAHTLAPAGGFARIVRISDLRKAYRVPLTEANPNLTRDDAMAVLAAAYRAEFNPVPHHPV
jgi:hypothetical protein